MEINILHHPSQESEARSIEEVLSSNGIASQLTGSTGALNGLEIAVNKLSEDKTTNHSQDRVLTSSFVEIDSVPGY